MAVQVLAEGCHNLWTAPRPAGLSEFVGASSCRDCSYSIIAHCAGASGQGHRQWHADRAPAGRFAGAGHPGPDLCAAAAARVPLHPACGMAAPLTISLSAHLFCVHDMPTLLVQDTVKLFKAHFAAFYVFHARLAPTSAAIRWLLLFAAQRPEAAAGGDQGALGAAGRRRHGAPGRRVQGPLLPRPHRMRPPDGRHRAGGGARGTTVGRDVPGPVSERSMCSTGAGPSCTQFAWLPHASRPLADGVLG